MSTDTTPPPTPPPAPDTSTGWYYQLDGETIGPVTGETILDFHADGELTDDSLVWHPTLDDWTTLGALGRPPTTPPPVETAAPRHRLTWPIGLLIALAVYLFYANIPQLPKCDAIEVRRVVDQIVNENFVSEWGLRPARQTGLRNLPGQITNELRTIKQESFQRSPAVRECTATMPMQARGFLGLEDTIQRISYSIEWDKGKRQRFYVTAHLY